jgi:outer membrane protein OmpA-like peptidoglycan-associated protein
VSESKKIPSLPPDDFSKTTPNMPRADDFDSADLEKTNYNAGKFAPQPPADDWGKTMANIPPIKDEPDFDKTFSPAHNVKTPDWGVTDQSIKLPNDDFGGKEDFGNRTNYGATTPFIHLPEETRAKYQTPPPTPTQKAEQEKKEEKRGGIPGWFWAVAGLLTMFFFALIAIFAVYFFFLRPSGFDVVIQGAPPRSRILVDGVEWSVTEGDGNLIARGLKANERKKIEIRHPNFTCDPREIEGADGKTETINARCSPTNAVVQTDDCQNIKSGEFEKSERCANQALDKLVPPYNPEDIAKALNLYIINFASGKYDIPPKNKEFLKKAATYLKQLPNTTQIEVGGHTDNRGSDQYNLNLSKNRAKAVYNTLVNEFGVPASMLTQQGYGKSKPKSTNDTDDGRFQNRRIEYTVLKK